MVKSRKTNGKNYRRKRRYNRYRNPSRVHGGTGVTGDYKYIKLKYFERYTVAPTTTTASQVMLGNGMNDPNLTGGGHQPMGYDQWANFYTKFCVYGSQCKVDFCNNSAGSSVLVAIVPKTATSASTTLSTLLEKSYVNYLVLSPESGGKNNVRLKSYMSTKRIFGLREVDRNDTTYTGVFNSSDPTQLWYWHVVGQCTDENTAVSIDFLVTITYYAIAFKRVALNPSTL